MIYTGLASKSIPMYSGAKTNAVASVTMPARASEVNVLDWIEFGFDAAPLAATLLKVTVGASITGTVSATVTHSAGISTITVPSALSAAELGKRFGFDSSGSYPIIAIVGGTTVLVSGDASSESGAFTISPDVFETWIGGDPLSRFMAFRHPITTRAVNKALTVSLAASGNTASGFVNAGFR